jgi:beta-N-acetylhexosaminidase
MEGILPGQLLLIGVPGPTLDSATAALFREIQPGGFILFSRNIKSPIQLRKLIDDLRDVSQIEPIITVDQEGGRVSRLREIGNEPPNAQQLRDSSNIELIRRHGKITGRLLRLFGFNLDLCPVLDISFDDNADNSLRGRCYGTTVEQVNEFAGAFNDAMREEGIASCGKHFPGYTFAGLDPHHDLPVIRRTRSELNKTELAVFRHFINRVDSMMVAHALYPALYDGSTPSSLSRRVVTDLLQTEMGFNGLIMTDDLDMGAILNHHHFEEIIRLSIEAGNDLAMLCHRIEKAREAKAILENLSASILDPRLESVHRFKERLIPPDDFSEEEFLLRDREVWQLRVDTIGQAAAATRSPEDGKRSPVELY